MKYAVKILIRPKESFLLSLARDTVTFGFLGLCIYVSKGSAFWTFVTGVMFLIYLSAKIMTFERENSKIFNDYSSAINFLNKKFLEESEGCDE